MPGIYGLLVVRNGYLVEERYWRDGARSKPHNVKSVSKGVISTLVGIAIDKGYFHLDQPIVELLPNAEKSFDDPLKKKITVRHLLTMRSGLKPASYQAYNLWIASQDWVKEALFGRLRSAPGETFHYSTANTHLLSVILAEATGGTTRSFAEGHLFGPMDIKIHGWEKDPNGVHIGGNNLSLLPRDLAKLGQLYLDGGRWGRRQLVPGSWVEAATRPTENGIHDVYGSYGYLWWAQPGEQGSFAAVGFGGQYVLVSPRHDTVIVVTSTLESKGRLWEAQLFKLLQTGILDSLVEPSMPPAGLMATVTSDVNLRARPSLNGRRLATLPTGREVELLTRKGDWMLARVDGKRGWLYGKFVDHLALASERTTGASSLSLAIEAETAQEAARGTVSGGGSAPRADRNPLAATEAAGLETADDGRAAVEPRPPGAQVNSELLALRNQLDRLSVEIGALNTLLNGDSELPEYRTTRRLNFRRGPSRDAQRFRVLDVQTKFQALGRSGPWIKARVDGAEGWVHSDYVQVVEPESPVLEQGDLAMSLSKLNERVRELFVTQEQRVTELTARGEELNTLRDSLAEEKDSRQRLAAEVDALRAQNRSRDDEFTVKEKRWSDEIEVANAKIAALEGEVVQAAAGRKEIEEALESGYQRAAGLQALLDEAQSTKLDMALALEALHDESEALKKRFGETEKQRDHESEAASIRIATLTMRAKQAEARRDELNRTLEESRIQLAGLEGALGDARISERALVAEVEALRTESTAQLRQFRESEEQRAAALAASRAQVSEIENRVKQAIARRQEIDDTLEARRAQAAKLENMLAEASAANQVLAAEVERLRRQNQVQVAAYDELEEQRSRVLEASRAQIAELENRIEWESDGRERIKLALDANRVQMTELKDALATAQASGQALVAAAGEMRHENEALRRRLQDVEERSARTSSASGARIAELEALFGEASAHREDMNEALAASNARMAMLEEQIAVAETFKRTLTTELEEIREQGQARILRLEAAENLREQEIEASRIRIARLESRLEQAVMLNEQADRELEVSRAQAAGLEAALSEEQAAKRALAIALDALREDGLAQRAKFDETERQRVQDLEAAQLKLSELGIQVEQLGASRGDMERALQASRTQVSSLEQLLDEAQAAKLRLTAEVEALQKDGLAQRAMFDEAEKQRAQDLEATRLKLSELGIRGEQLAAGRGDMERALQASRTQVASLEKLLEEAQSAKLELADEVEALRKDGQARETQFDEAEQALVQALELSRADVSRLEAQAENAMAGRNQMALAWNASREHLVKLQDSLKDAQASTQTLTVELKNVSVQNRKQRVQLDQIEKQRQQALDESRLRIAGLESQVEKAAASRKQMDQALDESRIRVATLKRTLADTVSSRQAVTSEIQALRTENQMQRARLGDAEKRRSDDLEATRAQIAQFEATLQGERTARKSLESELAALYLEVETHREQVEDRKARLAAQLESAGGGVSTTQSAGRQEPIVAASLSGQERGQSQSPAADRQEHLPDGQARSIGDASDRMVAARTNDVASAGAVSGSAEPSGLSRAAEIDAFVRSWADAWSQQAVDHYLAHYTEDFRPANGTSRQKWETSRRQRLTRPSFIEVTISDMEIDVLDASHARATFRQAYRADTYKDAVTKVLRLVRDDGYWHISREFVR